MRIALLSDIHANLPALDACLQHIDAQKPDAVYCLGDLVGYNVWPNEVIREIRRRGIPTIAGNYDQGIGINGNDCGCAYKNDDEKAWGNVSISYTNSVIGEDERAYLRTLPEHIRLQFRFGGQPLDILLVHGSPRRVNEYLFEDREERSLWRILEQASADVLFFGHTHQPYHRVLEDPAQPGRHRHAINTGSVGKPKDGDPRASYVLLTLNGQSTVHDPRSIGVEIIRVPYDVEAAARAVESSPLPPVYADRLRNAY